MALETDIHASTQDLPLIRPARMLLTHSYNVTNCQPNGHDHATLTHRFAFASLYHVFVRLLMPCLSSVILVVSLLTFTASATTAATGSSPRMILLLVDGLDLMEIASDPTWQELTGKAAVGLLNTRTNGRVSPAATHLAIGTGSRAEAPADAGLALHGWESISGTLVTDLFPALTGTPAHPDSVVVLSLGRLQRANSGQVRLGWLGNQLRAAGATVALVGNSDTVDGPRRHGALVLMDSDGLVPQGAVGKDTLRTDFGWPFGKRTDLAAVQRALRHYSDVNLTVVELGDLARLDAYRDRLTEAAWLHHRRKTTREIAVFLAALLDELDMATHRLLVVSPTPRADRVTAGQWLSPALLFGPNQTGLLVSRSTRRPGLILNTDIAPALVAMSKGADGDPLRTLGDDHALTRILTDYQRALAVHQQRAPVLRLYVLFCIGVFLAAWAITWLALRGAQRYLGAWRVVLLSVAAFPLALLLLPLLAPDSITLAALLAATLATGLALVCYWLGDRQLEAFTILLTATSVALLTDIVRGAPLIQWSILGYDAIGGARFYGIGNEFMGVLLSSTVMAIGIMLHRWSGHLPRAAALVWLGLTAFVIGWPLWGANNGGAVAAIVGFGLTYLFLRDVKVTWRHVAGLLGLTVLMGTTAALVDLAPQHRNVSHFGELVRRVAEEGTQPLMSTVSRKLAMNWRLLKYTIWTRVLLASLAVSLFLLIRPTSWLQKVLGQFPSIMAAAKGALLAALIALLVNDSGVVAAATAMIPVTAVLLFLASTKQRDLEQGEHPLPVESDILWKEGR